MRSESYDQLIARWNDETVAKRWNPLRMAAVFLMVFFSLQFAWTSCRGTALERLLIDSGTVVPAAWIIGHLWPARSVEARGRSIVSNAGRINVMNGCEGLELAFLLCAAFAAYPMPWRQRALGIGFGVVLAYMANQGRLAVLWYAQVHDRNLFGILHSTVIPLVLVALCALYFMAFIDRDANRSG